MYVCIVVVNERKENEKKKKKKKKKTTGEGKGREIDCLCIDSEFSFIIKFFAEYFTPTVIQSINAAHHGVFSLVFVLFSLFFSRFDKPIFLRSASKRG